MKKLIIPIILLIILGSCKPDITEQKVIGPIKSNEGSYPVNPNLVVK